MDRSVDSAPTSKHALPDIFELDRRFDADFLRRFDFDAPLCLEQMYSYREHRLDESTALISEDFEPARDVPVVHYDNRAVEVAARAAGMQALSRGELAVLVLNGGLATRFGGVVKGIVTVFDDVSFIGAKIDDVRRAKSQFGHRIPLLIMNSFATHRDTLNHLQQHDYFGLDPEDVEFFDQSVAVRLTEQGDFFFGADGQARYYAPGHGEFFQRLHRSGLFQALERRGVQYIAFSNIDNLGATIDPLLLGLHVESQRDMTVEVIQKTRNATGQWDVGGAPVTIGGHLQVVEGFRFPPSVPPEALLDFQTNNMYFSMRALREPPVLPRYLVRKKVDGRASIAFEAITCEASGVKRPDGAPWLSLNLIRVPRTGARGRFFPVKSQEDLELMRAQIDERLSQGWELRERELGC